MLWIKLYWTNTHIQFEPQHQSHCLGYRASWMNTSLPEKSKTNPVYIRPNREVLVPHVVMSLGKAPRALLDNQILVVVSVGH